MAATFRTVAFFLAVGLSVTVNANAAPKCENARPVGAPLRTSTISARAGLLRGDGHLCHNVATSETPRPDGTSVTKIALHCETLEPAAFVYTMADGSFELEPNGANGKIVKLAEATPHFAVVALRLSLGHVASDSLPRNIRVVLRADETDWDRQIKDFTHTLFPDQYMNHITPCGR